MQITVIGKNARGEAHALRPKRAEWQKERENHNVNLPRLNFHFFRPWPFYGRLLLLVFSVRQTADSGLRLTRLT